VVSMVRCPPDRPLLGGGATEKSEAELKEAAGIVRAVRKVAVVCACDGEHANNIQR
jgi:hypothetical protein